MMAIILASPGEGAAISFLRSRPEQPGLFSLTGHAIAAEIVEMRAERRGAAGVPHDAGLDDCAARARGDEAVRLDAGALAVAEARAIGGNDAPGARDAAARLLRGGQRLRDEGPSRLRTV